MGNITNNASGIERAIGSIIGAVKNNRSMRDIVGIEIDKLTNGQLLYCADILGCATNEFTNIHYVQECVPLEITVSGGVQTVLSAKVDEIYVLTSFCFSDFHSHQSNTAVYTTGDCTLRRFGNIVVADIRIPAYAQSKQELVILNAVPTDFRPYRNVTNTIGCWQPDPNVGIRIIMCEARTNGQVVLTSDSNPNATAFSGRNLTMAWSTNVSLTLPDPYIFSCYTGMQVPKLVYQMSGQLGDSFPVSTQNLLICSSATITSGGAFSGVNFSYTGYKLSRL